MPARDGDSYSLILSSSGNVFEVECVVSAKALKQGLSGRADLRRGTGMLFIFEMLDRHTMWMPDMNFPIDIVWLDETLTVVHITRALQPCASRNSCPSSSSIYPCKYAIEMNAGEADMYGFANGTELKVFT